MDEGLLILWGEPLVQLLDDLVASEPYEERMHST